MAERQKVKKQGRDDHKTVKYTTPYRDLFPKYVYNEKRYVGGLYT